MLDSNQRNRRAVLVNRYRGGGTCEYHDEAGRIYYRWEPTGKVYNHYPNTSLMGIDDSEALDIELEVVDEFYKIAPR